MKEINILILLILWIIFPTGCDVEGELEICPYNVKIDYFYSRYGTERNELTAYLNYHYQYLFDAEGLLLDTIPLRGKEMLSGEFDLTPGRYTLVSWANRTATNALEVIPGTTTLSQMRLQADNPYLSGEDHPQAPYGISWQADGDPLYYTTDTFTVVPGKILRRQAVFTSAHCRLTVKVRWTDRAPDNTGNFTLSLRNVPQGCHTEEEYRLATTPADRFYHIPRVYASPTVNHVAPATMDITREIDARIICHRLRDSNHPLLGLHAGQEQLLGGIDLQRYFRTMGIRLDTNILQDFSLLIEIDKDGNANIRPLGNNDWIDGGTIGSGF